MNREENQRYRIVKIRNGLWRLEFEDGSFTEHSTQFGAENMLLKLSPPTHEEH